MCEPSDNARMDVVSCLDIQNLLSYFAKNTYKAKESDSVNTEALKKCVELMKADYSLFIINNANGDLCAQYPSDLIILEYENAHNTPGRLNNMTDTIYESLYDSQKLRELFSRARSARCRARFPVPVILYRGKNICRSATLSGGPEILGRRGYDYLFSSSEASCDYMDSEEETPPATTQWDWQLFDRVRSSDIRLLKTLNVGTIIDFMVEKKKVKFGLNVTSSEKVDKENRYSDFKLISLPYPGCEFFKVYRDHNFSAEGLIFDWEQAYVDASICVPEDPILTHLHIEWEDYKCWDLVEITQNYMKLLLKYLQDSNSGLLIHCISGWDRTPLFVSLLRLSLWADGLAHQALDAQQILYLTIAYDWMLFGHHLPDRISKGEEIFFFCFYMLKHLVADDYSIAAGRHKATKTADRTNEKTVIRTDSDSQIDGVMLEHDPRGSNISLNSSCSSVSSKSQEQPPMWYHSIAEDTYVLDNYLTGIPVSKELTRSPQARRTSPVTVPATTRLRSKQESSPSLSIGSWQMITGTGSLRGSDTTSESNGLHNDCSSSQDSSHTLVDEDTVLTYNPDGLPNRKKRLLKVREIFYHNYSATIGFNCKDGTDSSIGTLLGNIAEKVGLTART